MSKALHREGSKHRKRSNMNGRLTDLARLGILDGGDQGTELVAHGLCGDASGRGLEVDVGCAADAGGGVGAGREAAVGGCGHLWDEGLDGARRCR